MPYELLTKRPLYRVVKSPTLDGEWIDGVYYPDTNTVITYEEFEGDWEPLSLGEQKRVLPEGVNSVQSIWVFTEVDLKISKNLDGLTQEGDIVYLEDPDLNEYAPSYYIFNKEDWQTNDGFTLLENDTYDYVCIRRELR